MSTCMQGRSSVAITTLRGSDGRHRKHRVRAPPPSSSERRQPASEATRSSIVLANCFLMRFSVRASIESETIKPAPRRRYTLSARVASSWTVRQASRCVALAPAWSSSVSKPTIAFMSTCTQGAIRGTQKGHQEAIRGHQGPSGAIRGHVALCPRGTLSMWHSRCGCSPSNQHSSALISTHQRHSSEALISTHQHSSALIRGTHQRHSSALISTHQHSSEAPSPGARRASFGSPHSRRRESRRCTWPACADPPRGSSCPP